MKTLLTGAYGRVGTAILDKLNKKYNFVNFDLKDHPDFNTITGNITNYDKINSAMKNCNNVIHLAASSRVDSSWSDVLENNIIGTRNCLESSKQNNINKVILASTNHVLGMYEKENKPEIYKKEFSLNLDKKTPVRPDSYYGTSKVFLESLGRYYVENYEYPKRVYVLRLGSIREPSGDHPYSDAEKGVKENKWDKNSKKYLQSVNRMKGLWQSRRDLAHMIDCCLKNDTVKYDIFNGISDNSRSWFDISNAKKVLDYNPKDSSDEWKEPPENDLLKLKKNNSCYN